MKHGDIVKFKSGSTEEVGRIVGTTETKTGIKDYTMYQEVPESDSGYRIYRNVPKEDIIEVVEYTNKIL
jgi:hypothetical protein